MKEPYGSSAWHIKLTGGTVVGKLTWYLRAMGMSLLGTAAGIVIGIVVGIAFNSGDAGVLTATCLFVVSVFGSIFYVKPRVVQMAMLQLTNERVVVWVKKKARANWSCKEIQRVHCVPIAKGLGPVSMLQSDTSKVTVERQDASIAFEMNHADALACIESLKTHTSNAVYTGPTVATHVPSESDRPDQVWRTKLRSELGPVRKIV